MCDLHVTSYIYSVSRCSYIKVYFKDCAKKHWDKHQAKVLVTASVFLADFADGGVAQELSIHLSFANVVLSASCYTKRQCISCESCSCLLYDAC